MLSNFGAACIVRNRFRTALKYLEMGAARILDVNECADIMVSFYVNYAEALFHNDRFDDALKAAETAARLARGAPPRVQQHTDAFLRDMKADYRRAKKAAAQRKAAEQRGSAAADPGAASADSSWFGWLWGRSEARPNAKTEPPTQAAAVQTAEAPSAA